MLSGLYPLQQIIFNHFVEPPKDDKNLIIQAQVMMMMMNCFCDMVDRGKG